MAHLEKFVLLCSYASYHVQPPSPASEGLFFSFSFFGKSVKVQGLGKDGELTETCEVLSQHTLLNSIYNYCKMTATAV
jgi:hypothetical protein